MTGAPFRLPSVTEQAERLIALGLAPGGDSDVLRAAAARLALVVFEGALLVLHERVCSPSHLAPRMRLPAPGRAGLAGETREGFVIEDMLDVDLFRPTPQAELPDADIYAVIAPTRGDELRNWSPEEASLAIVAAGRTPLTLAEGIHWALQARQILQSNAGYMTIGSPAEEAEWGVRQSHPSPLDFRWHRARRPRAQGCTEGRLVLVGQPPHLARFRLRPRASADLSAVRRTPADAVPEPSFPNPVPEEPCEFFGEPPSSPDRSSLLASRRTDD